MEIDNLELKEVPLIKSNSILRNWWLTTVFQDVVPKYPTTCDVEWVDAEDPLFLLYTSGSTGKPKVSDIIRSDENFPSIVIFYGLIQFFKRVFCTQLEDIWYILRQHSNMHLTTSRLMYTGIIENSIYSFRTLFMGIRSIIYHELTYLFPDFRCTADCGWITGHSYVTYGPMLNGATVIVFEGVMNIALVK